MSRFTRFGGPTPPTKLVHTSGKGIRFVDYKNIEDLRRAMSPNGKLYGRKRLNLTAQDQKLVAQAVKRARFLGLLPFTSATL
ncbi:MAG: 30S ribosomal protein S18 [Planctomycetota bacterium]